MSRTSRRVRSHVVTGRTATLVVVMTTAIGCARSEPTAPTRMGDRLPIAAIAAIAAVATANERGPQACMPDSKLIGRFAASTADQPGTWWRLTKDRFDALGVTDYKAALEGFYGQSFDTLDDAIHFFIDGVASWDANGNGYVCAFEVRGTRAFLGENALYLLGIADDKHY